MIVIGEKINGLIPKTYTAIKMHDAGLIRELAQAQVEFGADYLDISTGLLPEFERDTLHWLIDLVQDTVDVPLALDSSDPQVIVDMIPYARHPGFVNSVSMEKGKCDAVFPAVADTDWKIIVLTCNSDGIPDSAQAKYELASAVIEQASGYGIAHDRLYVDPLVGTLAARPDALVDFNRTVLRIRKEYPDVHILTGTSNISFGMPYRTGISAYFLSLAMAVGVDTVVMNPLSSEMRAALFATDALLGYDRGGTSYIQGCQEGLFGNKHR